MGHSLLRVSKEPRGNVRLTGHFLDDLDMRVLVEFAGVGIELADSLAQLFYSHRIHRQVVSPRWIIAASETLAFSTRTGVFSICSSTSGLMVSKPHPASRTIWSTRPKRAPKKNRSQFVFPLPRRNGPRLSLYLAPKPLHRFDMDQRATAETNRRPRSFSRSSYFERSHPNRH